MSSSMAPATGFSQKADSGTVIREPAAAGQLQVPGQQRAPHSRSTSPVEDLHGYTQAPESINATLDCDKYFHLTGEPV
jgi:hypothetical protein